MTSLKSSPRPVVAMKRCLVKARRLWHYQAASLLVIVLLSGPSWGQAPIAIPGNPQGDLATELLQSVTLVRGMEATLKLLKQRPELKVEAVAAEAAWQYSPFARGARFIEQDIVKDAGTKGEDLLAEIDRQSRKAISDYGAADTPAQAHEFLQLVDRRAKGGIEVPMVRGMLLWNCPEYQSKPGQEILDGYVSKQESSKDGVRASVEWPMSWKPATARNPKILQKCQSHWGHGKQSGMLRIDTLPLQPGTTLGPDQFYEEITREMMQEETPDVKLLSFEKTRLNGQRVILSTSVMEMEQLTVRLRIISITVSAYHRNVCAQVTCMVPAAQADDPQELLKKHSPLFLGIINSFRVTFPGET